MKFSNDLDGRLTRLETRTSQQRPRECDLSQLTNAELEYLSGIAEYREAHPDCTEYEVDKELERIAKKIKWL